MAKENFDSSWIRKKIDNKDFNVIESTFPLEVAAQSLKFHKQIPSYKPTPLINLENLAKLLKVGGIWVKNEALRLDLNSFKPLGGSFALFKFIQTKLNIADEKMSFEYLKSEEVKKALGDITFASATDGNHGKGLAWATKQLGYKCVIYVHQDTSQHRIDAISQFGATVKVIKGNYDDAVNQIKVDAQENGWQIVSDTSWEGYHQIPTWIMQGYGTLVSEVQNQLNEKNIQKPTHIFVQAGVGALAAAIFGYYHTIFKESAPECVIIEPLNAACIYESIRLADGKAHGVEGDLETIMAGLSCGHPSEVAYSVLKNSAETFIKVPDYYASRGMRMFASPLNGDQSIVSGESGAVALGLLLSLMEEHKFSKLRKELKLDENSQILIVNTEGDTDPLHYRQVVWEGSNPVPNDRWTQLY
ncbi:MAG: diaminopropionate ammonia-lyase [Sphaerochaetaceae bacterium]|jgi:diaminopropionate ammonia-lyase